MGSAAAICAGSAIGVRVPGKEEYGGQGEPGGGVAELLLLALLCGWENGKRWWSEARGIEDYGMCCRIAVGIIRRKKMLWRSPCRSGFLGFVVVH